MNITERQEEMGNPAAHRRSPLLEVRQIRKWFPVHRGSMRASRGVVKAVDGVSFSLEHGETLGLVGESGCGKTTLGYLALHLLKPTAGNVFVEGEEISDVHRRDVRQLRKDLQIIFQDPFSSLNPRLTVGSVLQEVLQVHRIIPREKIMEYVVELLELVGLDASHLRRYPHEFSGGQRQRIVIARTLALRPRFIVCDEPVSALDVSIQAQILNLLKDLQQQFAFSYLFIAHNLTVVKHMSDRIAVMYLGRIVELASHDALYGSPKHPYTSALITSIPVPDPTRMVEREILKGDVPSPERVPSGCAFHPRCPKAFEECGRITPQLAEVAPLHFVRCLLYEACVGEAG